MLALLLPPQISVLWNVLRPGIEASLPPLVGDPPDKMNRILTRLMDGTMQCWIVTEGEERRLKMVMTTTIVMDYPSGQKDLLVYSIFAYERTDNWISYFKPLSRWAAKHKCKRVTAFSNNPHVLRAIEELGGAAQYRYITVPIQP